MNANIRGYSPGEISAQGCTTIDITAAGLGVPLQAFIDGQYLDSKTMSHRPGMIIKYLPYRYDGVTGKLLSGGWYLFDTFENAKDYLRWADEEYKVVDDEGGAEVAFTKRPMFESCKGRTWRVIGAYSFAPVEEHAVGRLQIWTCTDDDVESKLQNLYSSLKNAAEDEDAASIWLLFDPDSKSIGLQMGFKKVGGTEAADATRTLEIVERKTRFSALLSERFPSSHATFDRTSVLLTLWLPKSREVGGSELAIPYYPLVPDITHEYL